MIEADRMFSMTAVLTVFFARKEGCLKGLNEKAAKHCSAADLLIG
jgi:hypothetical protein